MTTDLKNNVLICKNIKFYTPYDKEVFFETLGKIDCIDEIEVKGKDVYLHIFSTDIFDNDLRNLIAIFDRYKIDGMAQLKRFLTPCNKKWFYRGEDSFWHKRVFGEATVIKEKVVLVLKPLNFYTESDREMMFEWIDKIHSVKSIKELKRELRLFVDVTNMSPTDLLNFMGLFNRYGFDLNQLKVFMNEENKQWFTTKEFQHDTK